MHCVSRLLHLHAWFFRLPAASRATGRRRRIARLMLGVAAGTTLAFGAAAQPQSPGQSGASAATPPGAFQSAAAQPGAGQPQPDSSAARALQWPRSFTAPDGARAELYQPQIDTWTADRLTGRMAVAVGPTKGNPTYGVAEFSARADVNKPAGLVRLSDIRIERVQVPTAPQEAARLRSELEARIPPNGVVTPLDGLQLSYALSQNNPATKTVPVNNTPPRIIYRTVPAILVLVDGQSLREGPVIVQ